MASSSIFHGRLYKITAIVVDLLFDVSWRAPSFFRPIYAYLNENFHSVFVAESVDSHKILYNFFKFDELT